MRSKNQRIRGDSGYKDDEGTEHLNVLDFQREIRTCPKPVIAMVAGYAIGDGQPQRPARAFGPALISVAVP